MCLHRLPKYSFIELSVSKGLTEGNNSKGSADIVRVLSVFMI